MEWTGREILASPEDQEYKEENDDQNKQQDDTGGSSAATNRRMYDCSFCKRGFTNAQALGGHMNIHRKERAKSKHTRSSSSSPASSSSFSSSSSSSSSSSVNPNFNAPPAFQPSPPPFFPILESQTSQGNYYIRSGHTYGGFYAPVDHGNPHQELVGVDLSLGLGSMHVSDDIHRRPADPEDDDIDLELRLGHDP